MLSKKAEAIGRLRLRLRSAAALGLAAGEGIGRMRLRPAITVVPRRRRGKGQRSAAAAAPVLPDDALAEIVSRVPARSLCRFKCVSRAWRDLIADLLRRKDLPQTLEGFFYVYDDDDEIHGGNNYGCRGGGGVVHGRFMNTLGRSVPFASFSFLGEQPELQQFGLLRSCNGLLLFGHRRASDTYDSLGYIVCNPATKQWVTVPSSGWRPDSFYLWDEGENSDADNEANSDAEAIPDTEGGCSFTYLIFDPAVSSHFQLVQFGADDGGLVEEVHTYSSETGVWCERSDWSADADECTAGWKSDEWIDFFAGSAVVNGLLHFSVTRGQELIIVGVDGEGKKCRIISMPEKHVDVAFVGQSQGRLHYITQHTDSIRKMIELSLWVLQDYDSEEWVLKHRVTSLQLFQRMSHRALFDYKVVAIHSDCNLIFYVQDWDMKLKSYDMSSKEVCTLRNLSAPQDIFPYVPYYAESLALANRQ